MQRAPLLLPAVSFVAAIWAEQHAFVGPWSLCVLVAVPFAWPCLPQGMRRDACAALVACTGGVLLSSWHGHPFVLASERATARYTGTIVGDVRHDDDGLASVPLALDGIGVVRATLPGNSVVGGRVVVRGRLEPFDEPRNPGEPSMREIERDDGFAGRLASAHLLAIGAADPNDVRTWSARLRATASQRVRAVIPEPSATILAGALWGERGTLPDELHDAFQATGTVHVLVTAGLHLGIVAGLVALMLGVLGVPRIPACIIALAGVGLYVWFSGAHLPSQRAATMVGVALCARACGARVSSWNALALAAIVVAACWPAAVCSASFALSFSCVAAIVLFADPLTHVLERLPLPERVREALALTCATQIGTWPLTATVFSTVAPYAIVANAVVVPLVALALPGGFATLAVPALAPLETALLLGIEGVVRTVAALPGAQMTMGTPALGALCGYDALALLAGVALRRRAHLPAFALFTAACLLVVFVPSSAAPPGLTITQLDVGQGDAAVIRTPNGRTILIDTGGELEHGDAETSSAERVGARIVLGYLRRQGIHHVDLMLLTHPHGDHVGGCSPIIEALPVDLLFDSGQQYDGRAFRDCMHEAATHGVAVVHPQRGFRWTDDGVTLDILAPSLPTLADTGDDINENSIVAMLHYRGFRELFMGDAGESSEARLLAFGDDLRADVLKVGHHGSRYASTPAFIAAVHPRLAIISVGRHNTFGHPGPSTLATLERAGATIYRTDLCGAFSLDVDAGNATSMLPCQAHG